MKKLLILLAFGLFSFTTQDERKVTIIFTVDELQLVYDALGELPAKKVENLRAKIIYETQRQLSDTTKTKK